MESLNCTLIESNLQIPMEIASIPPTLFLYNMHQAVGDVWHVPIRDHDGGPGSEWFCVNLAAFLDRGQHQPVESRFGDVR